jgi:hypothetical protein
MSSWAPTAMRFMTKRLGERETPSGITCLLMPSLLGNQMNGLGVWVWVDVMRTPQGDVMRVAVRTMAQ